MAAATVNVKRWTTMAAAALLLALALAGARTSSALAWDTNGGCTGTPISSFAITNGKGKLYGTVKLFYNSRTGYNCAATVAAGWNAGVSKYMYVELVVNDGSASARDRDDYRYYAGPAKVYAPHRCITVRGGVGTSTYPRGTVYSVTRTGWCG